jgi:uncharacterized membrane protein
MNQIILVGFLVGVVAIFFLTDLVDQHGGEIAILPWATLIIVAEVIWGEDKSRAWNPHKD